MPTLLKIFASTILITSLGACGGGSDTSTPTAPDSTNGTTNGNGTSTGTGSSAGTGGTGSSPTKSDYNLYITSGTLNINSSPDTGNGATTLKVLGYSANETSTTSEKLVPGVLLETREGKAINVDIKNNLTSNHNFSIPNLSPAELTSSTTTINPNETVQYTITPSKAGIYLYEDTSVNTVNSSLGLFGALVVRPDATLGNVAWSGGPNFDKEVLWVISEMDYERWNLVALDTSKGSSQVNTAIYKPNYFLMNGMNGFAAMEDPATQISGVVGNKILVRIVNAGQYAHSLHFHGNHFEVLSRNGVRLTEFEEIDTINIKPKQTAIIRYTISQTGHYPMHVHTAQMETSNGVYLNGVAAMIIGKP